MCAVFELRWSFSKDSGRLWMTWLGVLGRFGSFSLRWETSEVLTTPGCKNDLLLCSKVGGFRIYFWTIVRVILPYGHVYDCRYDTILICYRPTSDFFYPAFYNITKCWVIYVVVNAVHMTQFSWTSCVPFNSRLTGNTPTNHMPPYVNNNLDNLNLKKV